LTEDLLASEEGLCTLGLSQWEHVISTKMGQPQFTLCYESVAS